MFEKLEFYVNLKKDFALTFIPDERSVSCQRKSPTCSWSATRDKHWVGPDSQVLLRTAGFGCFCTICDCSLFNSGCFSRVGGDLNLVNDKRVHTVLNVCTLKCVLCLYSCKYPEDYKRYLQMVLKYIDLVELFMFLSGWMSDIKNLMLYFFFLAGGEYF